MVVATPARLRAKRLRFQHAESAQLAEGEPLPPQSYAVGAAPAALPPVSHQEATAGASRTKLDLTIPEVYLRRPEEESP